MRGEYYTFTDEDLPQYSGCDHVFGVGNVVTGQGNIRVSLIHSRDVTTRLIENYLGLQSGGSNLSEGVASAEGLGAAQAIAVEKRIEALPPLSASAVAGIEQRIRACQQRVGYTSDYDTWIARETPPDLE